MEIKSSINCRLAARAILSEIGGLNVKIIATAIYDEESGATTSAYFDVPEAVVNDVRTALVAAIKSCQPRIGAKILDAIHVSREAAKRKGEIK